MKKIVLSLALLFGVLFSFAQTPKKVTSNQAFLNENGIYFGGNSNPVSESVIEIGSNSAIRFFATGDHTTIVAPVEGMLIYNGTTNELCYYDGSAWHCSDFIKNITDAQDGVGLNGTIVELGNSSAGGGGDADRLSNRFHYLNTFDDTWEGSADADLVVIDGDAVLDAVAANPALINGAVGIGMSGADLTRKLNVHGRMKLSDGNNSINISADNQGGDQTLLATSSSTNIVAANGVDRGTLTNALVLGGRFVGGSSGTNSVVDGILMGGDQVAWNGHVSTNSVGIGGARCMNGGSTLNSAVAIGGFNVNGGASVIRAVSIGGQNSFGGAAITQSVALAGNGSGGSATMGSSVAVVGDNALNNANLVGSVAFGDQVGDGSVFTNSTVFGIGSAGSSTVTSSVVGGRQVGGNSSFVESVYISGFHNSNSNANVTNSTAVGGYRTMINAQASFTVAIGDEAGDNYLGASSTFVGSRAGVAQIIDNVVSIAPGDVTFGAYPAGVATNAAITSWISTRALSPGDIVPIQYVIAAGENLTVDGSNSTGPNTVYTTVEIQDANTIIFTGGILAASASFDMQDLTTDGENNMVAIGAGAKAEAGDQIMLGNNQSAGELKSYREHISFPNIPAYDNDAAAGAAGLLQGTIWQTSATNTIGMPTGALMIKQ